MRIVNPQDAVLTNIEVLSYLTANPPRRPPNPPPNSRHWVPSPDLRDHNTVVKEIHNYATRLSPHILNYPQHTSATPSTTNGQTNSYNQRSRTTSEASTPMDKALRTLVAKLQPFGLTKGEVVMIINLGIGLEAPADGTEVQEPRADGMDVDVVEHGGAQGGEGDEGGGGGDDEAAMARDYGALALLDTVIEEREDRLSQDDTINILAIIRETLGKR